MLEFELIAAALALHKERHRTHSLPAQVAVDLEWQIAGVQSLRRVALLSGQRHGNGKATILTLAGALLAIAGSRSQHDRRLNHLSYATISLSGCICASLD